MVAIYVRVSTGDQKTASQESELKHWATQRGYAAKLYRDHGQSGAREHRPALAALLGDVRKGRIDVVAVWSLDRLARSLRHLLQLAEEFRALNVDLVSLNQNIDTATPAGRLTYQVLGAVAEFEREMIRERVRAGLAQARRAGKRLGRPAQCRLSTAEIEELRRRRMKDKVTFRALAKEFGITVWMAHAICAGTGSNSGRKTVGS
jgi:DNA invertase Pin-like site-specific DNA recombinase